LKTTSIYSGIPGLYRNNNWNVCNLHNISIITNQGDKMVACKALFGSCYHTLTKILPKYGIIAELVDGRRIINLERALSKKYKVSFF
tara:strand:+ start:1296 stop:1556 length:261 start_codon:yes stop_codon:yes gene_type:complete